MIRLCTYTDQVFLVGTTQENDTSLLTCLSYRFPVTPCSKRRSHRSDNKRPGEWVDDVSSRSHWDSSDEAELVTTWMWLRQAGKGKELEDHDNVVTYSHVLPSSSPLATSHTCLNKTRK